MHWNSIAETTPGTCDEEFMVWGKGWRYPAFASFDQETGEFFDPVSCATHTDPTHWMALPDPPGRSAHG